MIPNHRPARFTDDRWMRNPSIITNTLDTEHHIVGIFLQCVVDGRFKIRLGTIVINAQTATHIDVIHIGTNAVHFGVDSAHLGKSSFNTANVGDLATQMKMHQLQAIDHATLFKIIDRFKHFGKGKAELRTIPCTRAPATSTTGSKLGSNPNHGPDTCYLCLLNDEFELGEFFNNRYNVLAYLSSKHGHMDEFFILKPVADDGRITTVGQRHHRKKLWLGASFKTELKRLAEIENLFNDLPLLVNLDGVDATVLTFVIELFNRFLEGSMNFRNTMAQNISEANKDGKLDTTRLQLVD